MREKAQKGKKKGQFFSFYCWNIILYSFICFQLMVAIMSANETFDLASGSHFLVNTTGVSNIYSSVIEKQWAGVTYSCLVPTQS